MSRISLYILLVLVFLGLSTGHYRDDSGKVYIANERVFANFFKGAPLSLILVDQFQTGFLFKTHFHKYLIFHGFKDPSYITVRTSKEFYEKNISYVGMSLFRRSEKQSIINTIPMPPGSLFVGDLSFGHWEMQDSGIKHWVFHRAYRHFPKYFKWGVFSPSENFNNSISAHLLHKKPFFGINNEFGTNGSITKETIIKENDLKRKDQFLDFDHFSKYFDVPKGWDFFKG